MKTEFHDRIFCGKCNRPWRPPDKNGPWTPSCGHGMSILTCQKAEGCLVAWDEKAWNGNWQEMAVAKVGANDDEIQERCGGCAFRDMLYKDGIWVRCWRKDPALKGDCFVPESCLGAWDEERE